MGTPRSTVTGKIGASGSGVQHGPGQSSANLAREREPSVRDLDERSTDPLSVMWPGHNDVMEVSPPAVLADEHCTGRGLAVDGDKGQSGDSLEIPRDGLRCIGIPESERTSTGSSATRRIDFVQLGDDPHAGVLPRHAGLRVVPLRDQSPKDLGPVLVRQRELAGILGDDAVPEIHSKLRPLGRRQPAEVKERMRHMSKMRPGSSPRKPTSGAGSRV
jgi:hypothetical protein